VDFTEQSAIPAESTSNNFPVVKPAEKPYLRSRISHLLAQAEAEPDNLERWHLYQHIRELARGLRKQNGFLTWGSAAVVLVAVGFLLSAIVRNWPTEKFYSYPNDYLRVIQNLDPCLTDGSCGYRFVMQAVVNGKALPETEMHFCPTGEQPRFENGHSLSWIRYANVGSCKSIDGFDVVREGKFASLAPNCKPDYTLAPTAGHILCEGGRAKF
jgi:hypothetical protein